ncbi:MAG: triple tyrosine motif-containing protein, partial [Bacteroidota bacterium]
YIQDGLSDNEYNYSAFLKTNDGNIYLGGLNNYIHIAPFSFETDKSLSCKLSMDYISLNKKGVNSLINYEDQSSLKLHYKEDQLRFTFSLKNQIFSEFVSYQYRIEGLNNKWVSLNRQNTILVNHLPPGNYMLQIQSLDIRNKLNKQQIEIPFTVFTYFYESIIFYILVATLFIALIISIFIIRFNALKKIGRLKTDLSNDIHDEIGTIFTKAVMQLDILNQKVGKTYPEISAIERSLRDGIQRFRNVLWSLNTDHGKSDDFAARVNTTISEVFSDTGFDFRVTNKAMNIYFDKSIRVRRNLLLIIRELAHNTLKHSNGNMFEVIINKVSNKWILEIFDNGTNVTTPRNSRDIGIGLKIIDSRVASIKGKLIIENSSNCYYIKIII